MLVARSSIPGYAFGKRLAQKRLQKPGLRRSSVPHARIHLGCNGSMVLLKMGSNADNIEHVESED